MLVASFISDIKSKFFGSKKEPICEKITPIFDEYLPDLEVGEGDFYRRLKARQTAFDGNETQLYDLENGFKSIISSEVSIIINEYKKCKIIENYVSFMDVINYFDIPVSERDNHVLPLIVMDESDTKNGQKNSLNVLMDLPDDKLIDTPLHLCSTNIL